MIFRQSGLIILSIIFMICSLKAQDYKQGEIIDTIFCQDKPEYSYALFLPSNYDPQKKWPVVYAFDAAARGKLPLERFQAAAEKYQYILIGSYNYRNGPLEIPYDAFKWVSKDVSQRFSIDTERRYTTGFSGGSRFAMALALETGKIAGVIACGAGFPYPMLRMPKSKFTYLGIAGLGDMNYHELWPVKEKLDHFKYPNRVMVFKGTHEWPPEASLEEALACLDVQAMRKGLKKVEKDFIQKLYQYRIHQADSLEREGQLYAAYLEYQSVQRDFRGLLGEEEIEERIDKLKAKTDFSKNEKEILNLRKEEINAIELYVKGLKSQNLHKRADSETDLDFTYSWWRKHYDRLLKESKKASSIEKRQLAERLIDFIWRNAYILGNVDMAEKDYPRAIEHFEIWHIAQPQSPYPFYHIARAYAQSNKTKKAIKMLRKALDKGLNNTSYLRNDPAFASLMKEKGFQELLEELLEK